MLKQDVTLWSASYSACVVYTKLSVGESAEYLPPLRWIIVNYSRILIGFRDGRHHY